MDLICGFTHDEYRGLAPVPAAAGLDLDILAGRLGLAPGAAAGYREAHPASPDADLFTVMLSDALIRMPTTWVADAHAAAGGRTWLYDFAWPSPTIGAGHGVDVPFIFGVASSRFAARFLGTLPAADFGPLSERIRAAWTAFAATGDPGWPRYDLEHRRTRIWNTAVSDLADPLGGSRRIWAAASGPGPRPG